jgi:ATP-dependent Clp protease ATP-binding subunit ClpA
MFERFTERARTVMALANQEAQRFNHEYVGTEHILLGLVKEGHGVGANVLRKLGVDLTKVRSEVEKLVKPGPDPVAPGKLPYTPRAKKVVECAIAEARRLDHNYVGTEHVLLGLLAEREGVAAQVLTNLGVRQEDARKEILHLLGEGTGSPARQVIPSGSPAVFGAGLRQAQQLQQSVNACLAMLMASLPDEADRQLATRNFEELGKYLAAWPDLTPLAQQFLKSVNACLAMLRAPVPEDMDRRLVPGHIEEFGQLLAAWPNLTQEVRDAILKLAGRTK